MVGNLKISSLICEFNPLHLGHREIIRKAKSQSDILVCVMSGNFMQRGDIAIMDKWSRTEIALKCGADLLLELPLTWAMSGAERFAMGAVKLITSLNCVDFLFFGSETENIRALIEISRYLLTEEFSAAVKDIIKQGSITFASARENAVTQKFGREAQTILKAPNSILALEYIKALISENSNVEPCLVRRIGAGHDEKASDGFFLSASQLREMILSSQDVSTFMPTETLKKISSLHGEDAFPAELKRLELPILCKLRSMTPADFSKLPDIGEGLENRLFNASRVSADLSELYSAVKSKRYTHARIRRLILNSFLGVTSDKLLKSPPYLRILGFSRAGEQLIKSVSPSLPFAVRSSDAKKISAQALATYELESRSDDLWAMAVPCPLPCGSDYTKKLIKIDRLS